MTNSLNLYLKKLMMIILVVFIFSIGTAMASESKHFKGGVLIEANSGKVLYEYNRNRIVGQASITKVMTYLVFRDFVEENSISQSTKVKINISASGSSLEGGGIGLKNGNTITIKELNETLLIKSANDSALVMADYYRLKTKKNFVAEMNKKAKSLGLTNTQFINPHGLTDKSNPKSHKYNRTTAYETALLVNHVIKKYPDSLKITSKKSCKYGNRVLEATNKLLSMRGSVDGFKTGYTTVAGYCLASTENLTSTNGSGKPFRLIAVVLGASSSDARARECVNLLEYGKRNFRNNNYGGLAESRVLESARAKVVDLTESLKTGILDSTNQGMWENYIKQARGLIAKVSPLEKKEKESLVAIINKGELLIKVNGRVNQVEVSMEKNSKTMKNVLQWESYLDIAKRELNNIDKVIFEDQYKKQAERITKCQEVIDTIKANLEGGIDDNTTNKQELNRAS